MRRALLAPDGHVTERITVPDAINKSQPAASPDVGPILRRQIQLLWSPHWESVVPGVQVADGNGAILGGCVAIRGDLPAQFLIAGLLAPTLGEADEESLIPREAILHGIGRSVEGKPVSVICREQAGNVGNIFA